MRLVFHWSIKVTFASDVRLYLKGISGDFRVFFSPFVNIAQALEIHTAPMMSELDLYCPGRETQKYISLTRMNNESSYKWWVMWCSLPCPSNFSLLSFWYFNSHVGSFEHISPSLHTPHHHQAWEHTKPFQKVCAQLSAGVRFGIGFVPERSCGPECTKCRGTPFHRNCRHFNFRPHFEVKLEKKIGTPIEKVSEIIICRWNYHRTHKHGRDQRTPLMDFDQTSCIYRSLWPRRSNLLTENLPGSSAVSISRQKFSPTSGHGGLYSMACFHSQYAKVHIIQHERSHRNSVYISPQLSIEYQFLASTLCMVTWTIHEKVSCASS